MQTERDVCDDVRVTGRAWQSRYDMDEVYDKMVDLAALY